MSGDAAPPFETFRRRRVLVTGHTGFKGAWLAAWLGELGAEVTGYALDPPTVPSLFGAIGLGSRVTDVRADVRDLDRLCREVDRARPAASFHRAAQALVRPSYALPVDTFSTNVLGTAHLLEAVRRGGRPAAVIVVTSDKCYENREDARAYREDEPMGGFDPYSASKGAAEIVTSAYRRSFFPPERFAEHRVAVASVRAGNVIGGGDFAADRIVPDIVRALGAGEPVVLRNPGAVRPWQHVLDALSGYLALAARMLTEGAAGWAEAWNFGPELGDVVTVRELTERILRVWGTGRYEVAAAADGPHEARHLVLSIEKAKARLGWKPAWNVERAIEATVRWYRAAADGEPMAAFTTRQIREYSAEAAS